VRNSKYTIKLPESNVIVTDLEFRVIPDREFRVPPQDVVDAVSPALHCPCMLEADSSYSQHLYRVVDEHRPAELAKAAGTSRMRAALAAAGIAEDADARAWLRKQRSQTGGTTLPWYAAWRSALDALTRCAQHEQWDCPVACITAVSSAAANPIAELNDLSGQHRLPPSFAAEVYDPDMPRVYVLVHDASAPGASTEQLRDVFQQVTQHFPRDVTFPIVVNSRWNAGADAADAPTDSALWAEDASVPLLFSPGVSTLMHAAAEEGRAAGDQPWPAASAPLPSKGQWLSHVDVQRLQTVGSDITMHVVLPAWSRKMAALFTNVASQKKGIRNALRSWLKRPKDSSPRRSTAGGGAAYTPAVYSYGSLETQTRLLADSLAMVGDVNGAASVYRWAADEYKAAGAGLHYAAASEALAMCLLRTGGPSRDADVELENAASLYYSVARDAMAAGRDKLATHATMTGSTPPVLSPFSQRGHVQRALAAPAHLSSPAAAQLGATPVAPSTPSRAPGAARGTPQSAAAVQATPPAPPAAAAGSFVEQQLTLAQLLGAAPLPAVHLPGAADVQRRSAAMDISAARMAAKRQAVRRASRVAAMAADSILARNSRHALAASMLRRSGQAEGSRCLNGALLFEQAALTLLAANTANPATMGIGSVLATQPLPTPQVRKHAFHAVLAAQAYAGNSPPAPYHALRALASSRASYTPGQCSWPEVDALTIQDMAKSLRAMEDFAAASSTFAAALSHTASSTSERAQMDMLHELCAAFMQWSEQAHVSPSTAPVLASPGLPAVDVSALQVVSWDNAATAWACLAAVAAKPAEGFSVHAPELPSAAVVLPWHESAVHSRHMGTHAGPWQGCKAGEGSPRRVRGAGTGAAGLNPGAKVPPHLLDDSGNAWPVWSLLRAQMYASSTPAPAGRSGRTAAGSTAEVRLTQAANAAEDAWEALMEESRASGDSAMQLLAPAAPGGAQRKVHLEADVSSVSSRGLGQPFAVLITLTNPLRIPLHLTDVHLTSSVASEGGVDAAAGPLDTSTLPTGLTWVQQPACAVSALAVVLPPMTRCVLPLVVVPTQPGVQARLSGLSWKLGGVALCQHPVDVPGPLLNSTALQRARGMRGADNRLSFVASGRCAWLSAVLDVGGWEDQASCLAGEILRGTLHVCNRGNAALASLRMCVHGEGGLWAVPCGPDMHSTANAGGVQFQLMLPEGGLLPGGSMQVPIAVRASAHAGSYCLAVLLQGLDECETAVSARWGSSVQVVAATSAEMLLKQSSRGCQAVLKVSHASTAKVPHTELLAVAAVGQAGCNLQLLGQDSTVPIMRIRVGGAAGCVLSVTHDEDAAASSVAWVGQPPTALAADAGSDSPLWQQLLAVAAVTQLGERRLAAARLHEHQKRTSAEAADHLPPTLRSIRLAAAGEKQGGQPHGLKDGSMQGLLGEMLVQETHPSGIIGQGCVFWLVFVRWGQRYGMLQCGPMPLLQPTASSEAVFDAHLDTCTADAPLMLHGEAALWHRLAFFAPHRSLSLAARWPGQLFVQGKHRDAAPFSKLQIHSRTTDEACLRRMFEVDMSTPEQALATSLGQEYRALPAARTLKPGLMSQLDNVLAEIAPCARLNNSADMSAVSSPFKAELASAQLSVQAQATGLQLGKLVALCPITVTLRFNAVTSRRSEAWSDVQAVAPEVLLLPVPHAEGALPGSQLHVHWLSPQRQALAAVKPGNVLRVQLWAAVVCEESSTPEGAAVGAAQLRSHIAASSVRVKLTPTTLQGAPPPVAAVEVGPFADCTVSVQIGR